MKCWFLRRGETRVPGENLSGARSAKVVVHIFVHEVLFGSKSFAYLWSTFIICRECSAVTDSPSTPPFHTPLQKRLFKMFGLIWSETYLGCRDGAVVRALASLQCGPGSIPTLAHLASYVGWVCWFSTLHREVFLRVLRFSPLLKNQHLT